MNEHKIINDPVFGFIKIRRGLLYDIVSHPLFQRLNRIAQLGLTSVVYPGARHTRFQHSIGALHLMSEAVKSLTEKGIYIFDLEAEAVQAAILMHDIGHGPFSHVLENTLISGISHEDISLMMMEQMNRDMKGQLNLAISIFKDEYPNKIFHQLISSQLDMDRLDYLRRDSFYTGVTEGNIGSARIIKMLNVADDRLVVEAKGIYSVENYLTTRRLMYWQVYLHKTTVGYEKILATLASDLLDRHLFKVEVTEEPPTEEHITFIRNQIADALGISEADAHYLMSLTEIGKDMYNPEDDSIGILYKDGTVRDIAEASEILNVQLLSKKIRKYYLCYQRV